MADFKGPKVRTPAEMLADEAAAQLAASQKVPEQPAGGWANKVQEQRDNANRERG